MTERHDKPPHRRAWHRVRLNDDTTLAIAMAGVAALFIIGIVSAFNYAASTNVVQTLPATPPAMTAGQRPAETTGAGGGERPRPPQRDPREDEQIEHPR